MDLELLQKGLKKKRKWVFLLGLSSYVAYKVYNSPSVVEKRQRLSKLFGAFISVAEMVSHSSHTIGILSKDLKQFLNSDSDQIPQSFKQLSKIANSTEFSDTLTTVTRASAVGILTGCQHDSVNAADQGFSDKVMDKLFSDAGAGFASAVVGSFARNTVMALFSEWYNAEHVKSKHDDNDSLPWWIEAVCEDKCREVVGDFIRMFVSTGVTVYLEKTMNVNTYEEFFLGLTKAEHEGRVRDMLVCVCNNAVETCVRTSYHVWKTKGNSNAASSKLHSSYSGGFGGGDEKGSMMGGKMIPSRRVAEKSGWTRAMAVPRNRRLILDMTGVVTFESVRSFLEVVTEKMAEGIKTGVEVVQQEVVEKGVEAVRYASGRSSAITALCLTLCFNILNSPWILIQYT